MNIKRFLPILIVFITSIACTTINFGKPLLIATAPPSGLIEPAPTPGDPQHPQPRALRGTTWDLIGYGDPESLTRPPKDTAADITFEENGVFGNAGCNSYFGGAYTLADDSLVWDEALFGMTEMYCADEPVMALETAFMMILQATERFSLTETELTLYSPIGVLVFESPTATALEGTAWVFSGTSISGDGAVTSEGGNELTLVLAGGQVSGFAGCNNFNGSYTLSGSEISFSPMGATRMACQPDSVMVRERKFLSLFEQVASYAVERQVLRFFDAAGVQLIVLTAAE